MKMEYSKEYGRIKFNDEVFSCNDWADMSILCNRVNDFLGVLTKQEKGGYRSISINKIAQLVELPVEDLLDAPIFTVSLAGDVAGYDLLSGNDDAIYLYYNNRYHEWGV